MERTINGSEPVQVMLVINAGEEGRWALDRDRMERLQRLF